MSANKILIAVALAVLMGVAVWWAVTAMTDGNDVTEPDVTQPPREEVESPGEVDEADIIAAHLEGANVGINLDATGQETVSVTIDDFIFEPTVLQVSTGTTVTWTNQGTMQHDVTSSSDSPMPGLSSPMLANGESYSFTFEEPGIYTYFCQPHPVRMRAVVEVVE